jgi:hypothetical protein
MAPFVIGTVAGSSEAVRVFDPVHSRVFFTQCGRRGSPVAVLRNNPFKPEFASLPEQVQADFALLKIADENSLRAPRLASGRGCSFEGAGAASANRRPRAQGCRRVKLRLIIVPA